MRLSRRNYVIAQIILLPIGWAVFGFLALTFFFLFLGEYTTTSGLTKLGGYLGIVTAVVAWYTSMAGVMNATARRVLLRRPRMGRGLDGVADHLMHTLQAIGSPAYPTPARVLRESTRPGAIALLVAGGFFIGVALLWLAAGLPGLSASQAGAVMGVALACGAVLGGIGGFRLWRGERTTMILSPVPWRCPASTGRSPGTASPTST